MWHVAVRAEKVPCSVLSGGKMLPGSIQKGAHPDGGLTAVGMIAATKGSPASGKNGKEYFAFE